MKIIIYLVRTKKGNRSEEIFYQQEYDYSNKCSHEENVNLAFYKGINTIGNSYTSLKMAGHALPTIPFIKVEIGENAYSNENLWNGRKFKLRRIMNLDDEEFKAFIIKDYKSFFNWNA